MNRFRRLLGASSMIALTFSAAIAQADVLFWSTQARPVEEAQAMRDTVLAGFGTAVDYQPNEPGPWLTRILAELEAGGVGRGRGGGSRAVAGSGGGGGEWGGAGQRRHATGRLHCAGRWGARAPRAGWREGARRTAGVAVVWPLAGLAWVPQGASGARMAAEGPSKVCVCMNTWEQWGRSLQSVLPIAPDRRHGAAAPALQPAARPAVAGPVPAGRAGAGPGARRGCQQPAHAAPGRAGGSRRRRSRRRSRRRHSRRRSRRRHCLPTSQPGTLAALRRPACRSAPRCSGCS